jgi:hypothetical protein
MNEFLQSVGQSFARIVWPELLVVASRPVFHEGKWKLLYGANRSYRLLEFIELESARIEFDGICSFAAHRLGKTVCDFIVLSVDKTARVVDNRSYADVLDGIIRARSARGIPAEINLLSGVT